MHYISLSTGVTLLLLMIVPSSVHIDGLVVLLALIPLFSCLAFATGRGNGSVDGQALLEFDKPDKAIDSLEVLEKWTFFSSIYFAFTF